MHVQKGKPHADSVSFLFLLLFFSHLHFFLSNRLLSDLISLHSTAPSISLLSEDAAYNVGSPKREVRSRLDIGSELPVWMKSASFFTLVPAFGTGNSEFTRSSPI